MGKIFYIIGKSATGKDSIFEKLRNNEELCLKTLVLYTTRPIRSGEEEGREYYFTDRENFENIKRTGRLIEYRDYHTVHGVWTYFTVDDGKVQNSRENYIGIGTLESFLKIRDYYGKDMVYPIYVEVEDGERLTRALKREKAQENPKYEELCRRFLADQKDFSETNIEAAGINERFLNDDFEKCVQKIMLYVQGIQ